MTNYSQLNQVQRYQIEALLKAGHSQSQIARLLQVHRSTISRELKRNIPKRGIGCNVYRASNAQRRTDIRHSLKPKLISLTDERKAEARKWMKEEKFSPELISVRWREKGIFISTETIYKWIWSCKKRLTKETIQDKYLYLHLKHGRRRRKRGTRRENRGLIPLRVPIERRPKIVNKRKRVGDLEVDLMMGKHHKASVLVILDRASLKVRLAKVQSRSAKVIGSTIKQLMKKESKWIKTITFDNDPAFFSHHEVARKLGAKTFFTRPYTSQDKGSVENRIGILRRFIPKKTAIENIDDSRIKEIETLLNNRPVRKFNYKTPNQIFNQKLKCCTN